MKKLLLCVVAIAPLLVGCLGGRTEKLVTSDIVFKHGTNEMRIVNPKDVSFDDAMISPSDGTVRIKGYRSRRTKPRSVPLKSRPKHRPPCSGSPSKRPETLPTWS